MERILGRRFLFLVIVAVAAIATTQTEAQDLPCIADLAGCSEFYNNTSLMPTEECCGPLATALKSKSQTTCICAVFNNPSLQKQLGINSQMGLGLFNRCNITGVDPNICTSTPPASPPKKAPETPPSNGALFSSEWIGFSTFSSLLLLIMV